MEKAAWDWDVDGFGYSMISNSSDMLDHTLV